MKNKRIAATTLVVSLLLHLQSVALAAQDGGTASETPWSGYWWQHQSGGITGPLTAYDRLLGTQAAQWERQTHASPSVPGWFGHCHAWAASSVCEKEPRKQRTVGQVAFGVGDQKGLLAAVHAQDVANSYGDRYGDGRGSEDHADMKPDQLWRLLQMYVKQRNIPIVLDIEAGDEVWNYPVYQYSVDYGDAGNGWYNATMQIVYAGNDVKPDYVGTKPSLHKYTFRVKLQGGSIVLGSGEWTGGSVQDHPDFAWYPYVAVAENPEISVAEVAKIVGFSVGGESAPPPNDDENPPPLDDNTTVPPNDTTPPNDNVPPPDENNPPPPIVLVDPPPLPPISTQDLLSPGELVDVVLNKTSSFLLDIFTNKGDGGRYQSGEPIRVSFKSREDGYLYLFDIGPEGDLRLVFPAAGEPNRIRGGKQYDFPFDPKQVRFVAEEQGQHDLKAIVTSRPVLLTGFSQLPQQQTSQQSGGVKPPKPPQVEPRRLVVNPSCHTRVRRRLFGFFRKGDLDEEQKVPEKLGPFAQDVCAYFVLADPGKNRQLGSQR